MDKNDSSQQLVPDDKVGGSRSPADLPPIPEGTICPDCGYDLRRLTGERCPECGFPLELVRTREPQIPWSRRRELGNFRAYWQTVWQVGRRPRRFCLEMVRPVSYRDSQTFRWVTFLHAYLTILIGSLLFFLFDYEGGLSPGELGWWWWLLGSVQVVAALILAVVPGLSSYEFQSYRLSLEHQNRAIALSYYATAPLAATPIVLPIFALMLLVGNLSVLHDRIRFYVALPLFMTAVGLYLGAGFLSMRRFNLFAKYVLRHSAGRRLLSRVWIRLATIGVILLIFTLPLIVFYLLVIWASLK